MERVKTDIWNTTSNADMIELLNKRTGLQWRDCVADGLWGEGLGVQGENNSLNLTCQHTQDNANDFDGSVVILTVFDTESKQFVSLSGRVEDAEGVTKVYSRYELVSWVDAILHHECNEDVVEKYKIPIKRFKSNLVITCLCNNQYDEECFGYEKCTEVDPHDPSWLADKRCKFHDRHTGECTNRDVIMKGIINMYKGDEK